MVTSRTSNRLGCHFIKSNSTCRPARTWRDIYGMILAESVHIDVKTFL